MISKEMKSSSSSLSSKEVYECTFCKRGFSTAQALGGHMNVHRKDRAKAAASPTSSSTPHPPVPLPASKNSMSLLSESEVKMMGKYSASQTKYFPAEITGEAYDSRPAIIDFFDESTSKEIIVEESSTYSELDLELRLGHA